MKPLNFRSLDPDYTATGKVGLHHTSRGDGEVWREFASDPNFGCARRRSA